jgi:death-on-curing protein
VSWRWLSHRIATTIHLKQIQRHGGGHGIRGEGMLESALVRPQNLAACGEPTVFELAASYAFGLARNHPFVDGNKRTAFVASVLFLRLNGQVFEANQPEAALVFLRLAAGEFSEAELAQWFRRHSAARRHLPCPRTGPVT